MKLAIGNLKLSRAFTLIEIMVVIAIIGLVTAMAVFRFILILM